MAIVVRDLTPEDDPRCGCRECLRGRYEDCDGFCRSCGQDCGWRANLSKCSCCSACEASQRENDLADAADSRLGE